MTSSPQLRMVKGKSKGKRKETGLGLARALLKSKAYIDDEEDEEVDNEVDDDGDKTEDESVDKPDEETEEEGADADMIQSSQGPSLGKSAQTQSLIRDQALTY